MWSVIKYYSESRGLVVEEVTGMRCRVMHRLIDTVNGMPLTSGDKISKIYLEDRKSKFLSSLADDSQASAQISDISSDDEDAVITNVEPRDYRVAMEAEDILEMWFGKRRIDRNIVKSSKIQKSMGLVNDND